MRLTIPSNIGQTIVKESALMSCPLLATDSFIKFCKDRGLLLDRERLIKFEQLGLFAPVYRVKTPQREKQCFQLPITSDNDWFKKGWAWDTTSVWDSHDIPDPKDQNQEGYYSIFQITHLDFILNSMTLSVHMDAFLKIEGVEETDWSKKGEEWVEIFESIASRLRNHEHRRSQALLCQFISNRYYPHTQSDQREFRISNALYSDRWVFVNPRSWDWNVYVRDWKPRKTERLFRLTPEKLRRTYESLSIAQKACDPLERWYGLVQFISVNEQRRLKGSALKAETLRSGAHMLRLLYRDLYGEDLPHPNEVTGIVVNHVPEMEARTDTRRYLEFVSNRYGVNPQPKLCLIVEGHSEKRAVWKIFESWFGADPGKFGIEVITIGGVSNATGGKKSQHSAILRLMDYLHHHQTFTFLILDNENDAKDLKNKAEEAKSIHGKRRYVTRREYIKVWRQSFELDNFSATEITEGLNAVAVGRARFTRSDVAKCKRKNHPGACLNKLYKEKTGGDIPKLQLTERLVDRMLVAKPRRRVDSRPIVNILERVINMALQNPFPVTLGVWERNQSSKLLSKKGRQQVI